MNKTLPVMESFQSLQGEGHYQGTKAWFLRLAGCDVGCTWCDVKESWPVKPNQNRSLEEIEMECNESDAEIVVVTGGEPMMYDLTELTALLSNSSKKLHLETSGAYPLSGNWDWICLSPKKFKAATEQSFTLANELKVIVYNKHDLEWALEQEKKVNADCLLFLQPEWSKEREMLPLIEDFQTKNPKWQCSLQIHKYLGLP